MIRSYLGNSFFFFSCWCIAAVLRFQSIHGFGVSHQGAPRRANLLSPQAAIYYRHGEWGDEENGSASRQQQHESVQNPPVWITEENDSPWRAFNDDRGRVDAAALEQKREQSHRALMNYRFALEAQHPNRPSQNDAQTTTIKMNSAGFPRKPAFLTVPSSRRYDHIRREEQSRRKRMEYRFAIEGKPIEHTSSTQSQQALEEFQTKQMIRQEWMERLQPQNTKTFLSPLSRNDPRQTAPQNHPRNDSLRPEEVTSVEDSFLHDAKQVEAAHRQRMKYRFALEGKPPSLAPATHTAVINNIHHSSEGPNKGIHRFESEIRDRLMRSTGDRLPALEPGESIATFNTCQDHSLDAALQKVEDMMFVGPVSKLRLAVTSSNPTETSEPGICSTLDSSLQQETDEDNKSDHVAIEPPRDVMKRFLERSPAAPEIGRTLFFVNPVEEPKSAETGSQPSIAKSHRASAVLDDSRLRSSDPVQKSPPPAFELRLSSFDEENSPHTIELVVDTADDVFPDGTRCNKLADKEREESWNDRHASNENWIPIEGAQHTGIDFSINTRLVTGALISNVEKLLTFEMQPGVSDDVIKGAAMLGILLATLAHSSADNLVVLGVSFAATTSLLAISRGETGDVVRATSDLLWEIVEAVPEVVTVERRKMLRKNVAEGWLRLGWTLLEGAVSTMKTVSEATIDHRARLRVRERQRRIALVITEKAQKRELTHRSLMEDRIAHECIKREIEAKRKDEVQMAEQEQQRKFALMTLEKEQKKERFFRSLMQDRTTQEVKGKEIESKRKHEAQVVEEKQMKALTLDRAQKMGLFSRKLLQEQLVQEGRDKEKEAKRMCREDHTRIVDRHNKQEAEPIDRMRYRSMLNTRERMDTWDSPKLLDAPVQVVKERVKSGRIIRQRSTVEKLALAMVLATIGFLYNPPPSPSLYSPKTIRVKYYHGQLPVYARELT